MASRSHSLEHLESRALLSGLTVITHGFQSTGSIVNPFEPGMFPAWVYDMASAVNARSPQPCATEDGNGDGRADAIQNAQIDLHFQRTLVGSRQVCEHFLLFDWAELSTTAGTANSEEVAGVLAALVRSRLLTEETLDIHFIGHSRGAFVNRSVVERLNNDEPVVQRIGFLQMTTLDPQAQGFDGIMDVPAIVDWADNYYQTTGGLIEPAGQVVPGAMNRRLTEVLQEWNGRDGLTKEHSEVHDWYHWTVDLTDGDGPRLADDKLRALGSAERMLLYDALSIDLDMNGTPDILAGGSKIGFYHSLVGRGVGSVIHDSDGDLFTVDVRDGSLPLYLGRMNRVMYDMAYAPSGQLYGIDGGSSLYTVTIRFDDQNRPMATTRFIGNLGVFANALEFRRDGILFAAGRSRTTLPPPDFGEVPASIETEPSFMNTMGAQGDSLYWVNTTTGTASLIGDLPTQYLSAGDLEFDAAGYLYLTTTNGALIRWDPALATWRDMGSTGYSDIFGLIYSPEEVLYGFRNAEQIVAINLADGRTTPHTSIISSHPRLQGVYGAATVHGTANADVNSSLVRRLYRDILGREGTPVEVSYWTDAIRRGKTYVQVAAGFMYSFERRSRIVDTLYQQYLGRRADAGGLNYWIGVWNATGGPEHVQAGIIGSPEYYQTAGGTDAAWVTALYRNILGRAVDQAGLNFWVNYIKTHSKQSVVLGFVTSDEYRLGLITSWYQDYLGRPIDTTGAQYWLQRMRQGVTQESIQIGLLASSEYRNRP